ncbi:MAG: response regulator [Opitutaceae bacterium]|nr:response regulator [Opitutaceae bacterium]
MPIFITSQPPGENNWSQEPWDGLGGGLVVADLHGAKVGELALRVLAGEPAGSIPVVRHSPQRLAVNYRQMQRFGLALDRLPPGTQVVNAPTTFYQINRARLIAAGAIFVLLCAVIVVLSVTIFQRRRAERALRRAEEQLRSAQKMEAIGLLAGGVAHDFNNILQVVRGHAGFLQESLAASPQDREDIESIQTATQRAAQLTRQLLAFSRKQPLNMEPLEANALVADLAKMLRRVLGEHIALEVTPLPAPITLLADKGQLEQVLLNLCLNARDAMPGGGQIRIALERVTLEPADCEKFPDLKPGPHLVLKVSDTGSGMPRAVLDRLFEPFFTTKAAGKGTGLGLSVVYGIVRQHEGAISVYIEVGAGTVFRIMIPLIATELEPTEDPAEDGFPAGQGTILLAEDDSAVRVIAERLLSRNGFHVLAACDGEEAEAVIARHHGEIRLAVLDVLMPKRNGRQVHDYLKARHPEIPVLFCSGYTAEMLPPGTAPEPGYALLSKPYSSRDLLASVHRLVDECSA